MGENLIVKPAPWPRYWTGQLITICDDETKPLEECPILAALESSMEKQLKGDRDG